MALYIKNVTIIFYCQNDMRWGIRFIRCLCYVGPFEIKLNVMKARFVISMFIFLVALGCKQDKMTLKSDTRRPGRDFSSYTNLAQALRTVGSIQVEGSGNNVRVYMRGKGSIVGNTQPLFVVNGIPLGNDYAQANNAVDVRNIDSISTISGMSATTRYGQAANHGAILIKLKTDNDE